MIVPFKTFEEMNPAEQREHLLDILTDDGKNDVDPEELRKFFLQRVPHAKDAQRDYFTCAELGKMVGRSAVTIRKMFEKEKGVIKRTFAGQNRKAYTTMLITRASAKRRFPDLNI